jgi:hypothetical protein
MCGQGTLFVQITHFMENAFFLTDTEAFIWLLMVVPFTWLLNH